jgi:two-component system, NtrC family, sensor histidine kinase KinB
MKHLQTRFILAGCLLIAATIGSSVWSALTFVHLTKVVDQTIGDSRDTIDLTAELAKSLEREDDALLLAVSGDVEKARRNLADERRRGDGSFQKLRDQLRTADPKEQALAQESWQKVEHYRKAGNELLEMAGQSDALAKYHRDVNPLLRDATGACDKLREANFRSMEEAGVQARDEASRGTRVVTIIAILAVLGGITVAVWLARSVIGPVRKLTASMEAVREGNFDQRVPEITSDELGQLAAGFNRMAEALAEYQRSSLGELLAAKTTLEATLNALPNPVFVFAPDGSLAALNAPATDILKDNGAGKSHHLNELPFSDENRTAVAAALAGRDIPLSPPQLQHTFNVVLGGQPRRFLLTAVPIQNFAPGRPGAVAILDDVTEFARLDELRSELIGVASHELRSPLTSVRMNLLMLKEQSDKITPRCEQLLAAAVQGCEELGATIEELLDVTRIEAGQLRLNVAQVDLEAVLSATMRHLRQGYDDAGVKLKIVRDAPSTIILADAPRLGSVFANVLNNALKYSPSSGAVVVRLSSGPEAGANGGQTLHVSVTDQGPGIPVEYRERVFEKFFRVEHHLGHSSNGGVRGTGIGLYLCREIIKAHGGAICCESGEGGIGTRIDISLPRNNLTPVR